MFNTTTRAPLHTNKLDGFLDEILQYMLKDIGYRLETVELPAERGLVYTNSGKVDGEMSRVGGMQKRYQNLIPVPEKIMDMEFVVYSKLPIDLTAGWNSLANRTVAYINGWKILEKNVPGSAEVTKVSNPEQLFTLLKNDRTDYIIYIRWSGNYLLREMQLHNVSLQLPALVKKEMFIYLHSKHRDKIPGLARSLAAMKNNGEYKRLVEKHLFPLSGKKL